MRRGYPSFIIPALLLALPAALRAQASFEEHYHLLYQFNGVVAYQDFGSSVYLAGDVNGDGYGDILIGAEDEDVGPIQNAGRAYVYSGLDGSLMHFFSGVDEYAIMGRSLSSIEDTDGDGLPEILVGAPGANILPMYHVGKVYHYSGVSGSLVREYQGETVGSYFSCDLEGIGDADGDGFGDLIVGAEYYDTGPPTKRGAAYVFSGQTGDLLYKFEGSYSVEGMGHRVCRTGDVDLDQRADFAYLTLFNKTLDDSGGLGGRVTVRSGTNGDLITNIYGDLPDAPFYRLEYGGDVNGDGLPELLIGQINYPNGPLTNAGRAFVYSGKDWSILYTYVGHIASNFLGGSLCTAGDLNRDGYGDVAIAAYGKNELGMGGTGAVYVYSGKDGRLVCAIYGSNGVEGLGLALHGGGDVNGDGLPDLIIKMYETPDTPTGAGAVHVYAAKSLNATDEVPPGGTLEFDLRVPAQPFGWYYLAFFLGIDPGLAVGTRTLPLNWDPLFEQTFANPLCTGTLDAGGGKEFRFRVPNDPALSGFTFYSAFLTLKKEAPMGVGTISNPERIAIQ